MNRHSRIARTCFAAAILQFAICDLRFGMADDWPQFRGPNRDGVSKETGLLKSWPAKGPPLLWTYQNAGAGFSTPAVVGDRLYLCGARGDTDYVFALDLNASPPKEVWAVKIGPKFTWKNNTWNEGPSATPTVDRDLVFALGGFGDLVSVGATDGQEKWRKNLVKDLNGEINPVTSPVPEGWGYAGAPLVDGDNLICVPGGPKGAVAALNKKTGGVVWRSKEFTDQATYAAAVVAEIAGVKQYVVLTNAGVAGIGTKGALLWYYKRKNPYGDIVACTPLVHDGHVFVSAAGRGGGSDCAKIEKRDGIFAATKMWAGKDLANLHGGVVLVGEHFYGASGDFGRSFWVCLSLKNGKPTWREEDRDLGKGSLTYADGGLYCLGEKEGRVKLVQASPEAWNVRGDFQLPNESKLRKSSAGFWTHPVIANGRLYLRDQELLFCYDVKDHANAKK